MDFANCALRWMNHPRGILYLFFFKAQPNGFLPGALRHRVLRLCFSRRSLWVRDETSGVFSGIRNLWRFWRAYERTLPCCLGSCGRRLGHGRFSICRFHRRLSGFDFFPGEPQPVSGRQLLLCGFILVSRLGCLLCRPGQSRIIQLFFGEKQPGRAAVSVLFHLVYSSDLDCVTRREPQWACYVKLCITNLMKSSE